MISVFTRTAARAHVNPQTIRRRCAKLLSLLEHSDADIAIVLTDDCEIRELNADYRQKDKATDVLSFPQDAPDFDLPAGMPRTLGDVVISVETAARQAQNDGCLPRLRTALGRSPEAPWSTLDETTFLLVHGVLHLLGHDHMEATERHAMERLEHQLVPQLIYRRGKSGGAVAG